MNPDQITGIEFTVATIEKNLDRSLHLDELSKEVGISKYHLLRLFKAIADKTLMSYVRGRRLSLSLLDLINTDSNILDIAMKYQFEYEQSYIRAFQNQFHITPAKYRKLKYEMPIEQKIDMNILKSIGQGFVIQPKMVVKPAFYVQGIKKEIFHEENFNKSTANQLAIQFRSQYISQVPDKINEHIFLGLILYRANRDISNDYMPCVETRSLNKVEPPFYTYTVPSQEYAVFRYVGLHAPQEVTFATLLELYQYIKNYWQVNTSFKLVSPFHFERMDLSICSDTYCEMDIYYPLCSQ